MKWEEIKAKTADELKPELALLRSRALETRFRVAGGSSKAVHEIAGLRRTIARVITRLAQLEKV